MCIRDSYIKSNTKILDIKGNGVALLEGERVALNILQRLCGIATLTKQYVEKADPVQIFDTRKTTPGLRSFEKYAVSCGGGKNHRFGLYDAVLIKDNHIKASGGIIQAVRKVKKNNNIGTKIEVETTNDDLLPFLLTIPLQKLAYYSALKKGFDIDKPRNLAKSVTVE